MDTVKNTLLGHVERAVMNENDFETQRRTFVTHGYAVNPANNNQSAPQYVGNVEKAVENNGATVYDRKHKKNDAEKKKRMSQGDPTDPHGYLGPWAGYEDEEVGVEVEQEASEEELAKLREFQQRTRDVGAVSGIHGNEFSTFHGTEEKDYMGRTYIDIPKDVDLDLTKDPGEHECYTPKTLIHTW